MKVLLVSHGYPPVGVAGVERLSAQTAETLTARGHEVTVLTRRPAIAPETFALEQSSHDGVPVVSIAGGGSSFGRFPLHEPALERLFERMLVELAPDVVLATHLLHHSPGYVAVAHRFGVPVILELHDFYGICPRAHLQRVSGELCDGPEGGRACARHCFADQAHARLRWAMRSESFNQAIRHADAVVVPSEYLAEKFEAVRGDGSPIRVIENAVADLGPMLRRRSDPAAPLHLASIGVTVEHKGFGVVVEALRLARLEAARYSIFGVALEPEAGRLRRAADEVTGLDLRLFGGFSPAQLPVLLADVDVVVVPSTVPESYSIVVREAFAHGIPVIASEIGALPAAIRPGENGWLFVPGDAAGLAALLQPLAGERHLVERAAAGIAVGDVTSVPARTTQLEELLEQAIGRGVRERDSEGLELALMRDAVAADIPDR